jgi:hypothetical protein
LNVTSSNGCHGFDTIHVNLHHLPDVNLGLDMHIHNNESIMLDAGSGYTFYTWNTGTNGQTMQVNGWDYAPGIYTFSVTVVDSVGCFNTDQINITITESSDVSENLLGKFSIFPNPFHQTFYFDFDKNQFDGVLFLIDVTGRRINTLNEKTTTGLKLSCNDILPGIYQVMFEYNNSRIPCGKIIAK